MRLLLLLIAIFLGSAVSCHALYVRTFGNPRHPAVVFLHGGPGYNSATFEATAAAPLAAQGFFVVVYDRRGEGRSAGPAAYTFDEATADLKHLCDSLSIRKAVLVGHSFGGIIGTRFATAQPDRVSALLLVSAPVALQESFRTIRRTVRARYAAKGDSVNLAYIAALDVMDTASLAYASYHFGHAMQSGLYATADPTEEARSIGARFRTDTLSRLASQMTMPAPMGFWRSEHYTTLDLAPAIAALVAARLPVYGLYGKEDGLYAPAQVAALAALIGERNLRYLDRCSHNVFIDRQPEFIAAVRTAAGK